MPVFVLPLLLLPLLTILLPLPVGAPSPEGQGLGRGPRAGGALSPEGQGLRPGGMLSGLPPALLERTDRLHDPTPHDLNATLLRARLGRHFDPRVMSIVRPQRSTHKNRYNLLGPGAATTGPADDVDGPAEDDMELDEDFPFRRNRRGRLVPVGRMPASLASLDFRAVRLPDGSRLRSRISPRLKRKLQHFLWAYTACPVTRRWRDLGLRFWPRWLKEGHCAASPCSIPPGMRCLPSNSRHQALLRWHCRPVPYAALPSDAPSASTSRHCSWIKVEYPVITECSCGCQDDHFS